MKFQVRTQLLLRKQRTFSAFFYHLTSLFKRCLACSLLNPRTENLTDTSMEFNLENPLTNFNDSHSNAFTSLFLAESEHMPAENYFQSPKSKDFDISVRRETISIISQVRIMHLFSLLFVFDLDLCLLLRGYWKTRGKKKKKLKSLYETFPLFLFYNQMILLIFLVLCAFWISESMLVCFFQLSCNFDPLLSYLAVNYLDRFLSSQGMLVKKPSTWRLWIIHHLCWILLCLLI